jgi:hypothetical protein
MPPLKYNFPLDMPTDMNRTLFVLEEYGDVRLLILTLHLYAEASINRLIRASWPRPEKVLEHHDMRHFGAKVDILEASGVIVDVKMLKNLRLLNKMRNDVAHNLRLSQQTVKNRINEWMPTGREVYMTDGVKKISDLPELERLDLLAAYLIHQINTVAIKREKAKHH